ncbi:SLATT domain-containing protein [Rhizobium laguerreae]|uniref:SLATT domain-containing protein n=1 Tax=Rhizobium laguerreae TaxID=1076926 RepID=UPI001C919A6F|nr:SLATT domain-containing protein [Rhizobium laguerreae]MBY3251770.1 SLATT domain-containing protein [Rhizobium laguerreae]
MCEEAGTALRNGSTCRGEQVLRYTPAGRPSPSRLRLPFRWHRLVRHDRLHSIDRIQVSETTVTPWGKWRHWANIVLSSLITGGAVSVIFAKGATWEGYASYGTAALSILSLIFNAYLKDLDPGALAQRHREAASDMWNVREAYLSLLTDIVGQSSDLTALRERRDNLQAALHKIYHAAPHTDGKAYGRAQDALKNREDLTFSEHEIDVMLPESLRRNGSGKRDVHEA